MKKNGFTLVELIAVVVILAIISVIAIPVIVNQVDETRIETYRASVRGLFDSVNSYLASNDVTGYLSNYGIHINDDIYKKLDLKNDEFINGRIYLDSNQVLQAEMISDGYYCANGSKGELTVVKGDCAYLDQSAPEVKLYLNRVTSNSITVVVNSIDDDSGIKEYSYYLNGSYVESTENNVYTFKNLKANTKYEIMIKVINGNNLESTDSISVTTNTNDFVWKETPTGWSHSKTVSITYPSIGGGEVYQYQVVGEGSWVTITGNNTDILIDKNSTITARILKEGKVIDSSSKTIGQIDNDVPVIESVTGNDDKWTTSKRILIKAVDRGCGLADKAYSFDGGKTWQASSSKTFTKNGTLNIQVKDKLGNVTNVMSVVLTKVDSTILKAHNITATTADGKSYTSGNWSNKTVILKANPSPSTTLSGLVYKWYKKNNGDYVELTGNNNSTLEIKEGTGTYKVEILTGAGAGPVASSNTYNVKVDTTAPIVNLTGIAYTNKVALTATCVDNESGITKYEFSKDGGSTWNNNGTTNTYTYTGLTQGTSYTFKVRCTNQSALSTPGTYIKATGSIVTPTWGVTPSGYTSGTKTAKVTYSGSGIDSPVYFLKSTVSGTTNVALATCSTSSSSTPKKASECTGTGIAANRTIVANTWYMVKSGTTVAITVSSNGSLVAVTSDETNIKSSGSSGTVSGIDKTPPSVSLSGKLYTDRAALTATCIDNESGITKYEFSKDGGSTWNDNGTTKTYTYTGLTQGTSYDFKVRCTNGSKLKTTGSLSTSTASISAPTWGISPSGYTNGNKTATVTYISTGISSPVYFLKTTVVGTTNVALTTCSTSSSSTPKKASECTGTAISASGAIAANTWYMVKSGTTAAITVSTNGSLVAVTSDGTNTKTSSSATVTGIDKTAPSASFSISGTVYGSGYQSGAKVTVTCTDNESGIASGSKTETLSTAGTNTVSTTCKDNAGNTKKFSQSYVIYVNSAHSSCGNKTCAAEACGVESYKSCANSACGYSCSSGYTLSGTTCSKTVTDTKNAAYNSCLTTTTVCNPGYYCTSGTLQSDVTKCAVLKRPTCPSGKTLISGSCYTTCSSSTDCENKCGRMWGYVNSTMVCSSASMIAVPKECPSDYRLNTAGEWCYKYIKSEYSSCLTSSSSCQGGYYCDNGYILSGTTCSKTTTSTTSATAKTCSTAACGVQSYKTCTNAACGYNTCWHT